MTSASKHAIAFSHVQSNQRPSVVKKASSCRQNEVPDKNRDRPIPRRRAKLLFRSEKPLLIFALTEEPISRGEARARVLREMACVAARFRRYPWFMVLGA
jgi:hypothetical protein